MSGQVISFPNDRTLAAAVENAWQEWKLSVNMHGVGNNFEQAALERYLDLDEKLERASKR